MAVKNMIPKGYHKMPDGKLMKNSDMKGNKSYGLQNKRSKTKKSK